MGIGEDAVWEAEERSSSWGRPMRSVIDPTPVLFHDISGRSEVAVPVDVLEPESRCVFSAAPVTDNILVETGNVPPGRSTTRNTKGVKFVNEPEVTLAYRLAENGVDAAHVGLSN